jgi:hypothetical protein
MSVQLLKYENIDKARWDKCIEESTNGLIYAESAYLDHMAHNWEALVMGDYETVMPVIWNKKKGIRYCYQPAFLQQGGIFSSKKITTEIIDAFLCKLSEFYKFAEININYFNSDLNPDAFYKYEIRHNFILNLGKGYQSICRNYSPYIRQRISRSQKNKLTYKNFENHALAIDYFSNQYLKRIHGLKSDDLEKFRKLCDYYQSKGKLYVRAVYQGDESKLLAVVLMLKDNRRIYNMASTLFEEGKKMLANYFLYDKIFQEFGNQQLLFDFEGSDIPGILFFYEKFAEKDQPYFFIRYNQLPFPYNLFKKR